MHNGYPLLVAIKLGRPAAASTRHATVLRLALLVAVGLQGAAAPGQPSPDPPAEARFASAPTVGSHSPGSGPDESAEDLFAQLLDAVRADPQPSGPRTLAGGKRTRREVWASDVYASRRAKLLALGPAAEEVVARNTQPDAPLLARVIAGGLTYELNHYEEMVPFYEHVGRVVSGTRSFRGVSRRRRDSDMMMEMGMGFGEFDGEGRDPIERVYDYEEPTDLADIGFRHFWSAWGRWTPSPARIPAPLQIEQAAAWPDDRRLRALADVRDDRLAFEVLQWVLLEEPDGPRPIMRDYRQPGAAAVLALAEVRGARAIDVYRRHLELRPAAHVEAVIEALIRIGDPRGAEVLEAIAGRETHSFAPDTFSTPTYRAAAADARTVLPLLKDGPERLVELLGAESAPLRPRAAISLAGRGDLRAVPVLFEAAAAPPDLTTRRYWRPWEQLAEHQRSRDALVALGEPALPALQEAAARSEAVHAALLAEVVTLHVERPELIERFHMAMHLRTPGFGSMLGPSLRDFRVTGWQVADLLGARATALLEAVIVWPPDSFQPRIAAFALARFRQERSIDVLVTHAATIGSDHYGGNLTVGALEAFGDKGVAAARRLEAALERPPIKQRETSKPVLDGSREPAQHEFAPEPASDGAARLKGDATPAFLLEQLAQAESPALRASMARSLAGLRHRGVHGPFEEPPPTRPIISSFATDPFGETGREVPLSQEEFNRHAPQIRRALLELLDNDNSEVQVAAAEALAWFLGRQHDDELAVRLAAWLRNRAKHAGDVLNSVRSAGAKDVSAALHAIYLEEPLQRPEIALRLAQRKYMKALGDVKAALDQRLTARTIQEPLSEVSVLLNFGPAGYDVLLDAVGRHADLQFGADVLARLVSRSYEPALEPAVRLFDELTENGVWDPRLKLWDPQRPMAARAGRSGIYQGVMLELSQVLLEHHAATAYPRTVRALEAANVPPEVRSLLAGQLRESGRPRLDIDGFTVAAAPGLPSPAEPVGDDEPEISLLAAVRMWLKALEQPGTFPFSPPPEPLLAAGDDALHVGIDLLYVWPVPSREQLAAALANLTAADPARRRQAEALLALRAYPASYLDDALAGAEGEALRRGQTIRRWRQHYGSRLDAVPRYRDWFANWLLRFWPKDELRAFTLGQLERLATIEQEGFMGAREPLYPLLVSLRYSPDPRDRERLVGFAAEAPPATEAFARRVLAYGVQGLPDVSQRWDPPPRTTMGPARMPSESGSPSAEGAW